jgi:L-ascorbate metabolism protein UlaG (beta-lactamase superfamily)
LWRLVVGTIINPETSKNGASMKISAVLGMGAYRWRGAFLGFALTLGTMAVAQEAQFTTIQRLTNREVALRFNAPAGTNYRVDVATNFPADTNLLRWSSLLTLRSAGVNQHTDAAAPFASARFYRAEQLTNANALTGDHLVTTNGDVVIHPVNHASFVMSWNGRMIYNDPVGGAGLYAAFPRADLILVSHSHSDHYDATTLNAVRGVNGVIIVPQAVYNLSSFSALRPYAAVLAYNAITNVPGLDIAVQAVAGYNGNHAFGINNCYVITIGGKRIFTSGDTGDTAEMRALTNIDVAFLAMNMPFTMNWIGATNNIRAMRPKVVYPYHYRDSGNTYTNPPLFKQMLGTDLGIEVRLRNWY